MIAFSASAPAKELAPAEAARALPAALWEVQLPTLKAGDDPSMTSPDRYADGVEALLRAFEAKVGRRLTPGEKGKVGLKIYAESGPGLQTPQPLVRAVIEALMRRGYTRENIFLVGLNQLRLRMTGYLPTDPRVTPPFAGHPFFVLESGRYYDPVWFYDSPLPSRFDPILSGRQDAAPDFDLDRLGAAAIDPAAKIDRDADRKSFLATPLFLDADFWINLPVYTDHEALGCERRAGERDAVERVEHLAFFQEHAQRPGGGGGDGGDPGTAAGRGPLPWRRSTSGNSSAGPAYNSLYTRGEPKLWLGTDPVRMDELMRKRINQARLAAGFQAISDEIRTLEFAETLGLGEREGAGPVVIPATPAR